MKTGSDYFYYVGYKSYVFHVSDPNTLLVSITMRSPKDADNRKLARSILRGRLNKGVAINISFDEVYFLLDDLLCHYRKDLKSLDERHDKWCSFDGKELVTIFICSWSPLSRYFYRQMVKLLKYINKHVDKDNE